MSGQALDNLLADGSPKEYVDGLILGVKHALKLDDILGLIPSKKP